MPLRRLRPMTSGQRGTLISDFSEITRKKPHKPLTRGQKSHAGRNSRGIVTVRHRGSGAKQLWRLVDFKRDKVGVPCRVESIEYDPGRSARIALVVYADGERRYHLAPVGVKRGG